MSTKNRKIWAAGVLLILTVAAAIGFLFRLSQPDQEQRSVYLNCTESDRGGWVFFTEAGPVEPVFGFGGYINGIPAEGTGPVAAERVMEEPGARHFLQFDSYGAGLQVFLDHTLLYTDFPAEENPVDSFLEDVDPASISHDGLRVPLPEDCGGKRLRIVTYGPSGDGLRQPVLPSLVGRFFRRRGTDLRRRLAHGGSHGAAFAGDLSATGAAAWRTRWRVSLEAAASDRLFPAGGGSRGLSYLSRNFGRAEC